MEFTLCFYCIEISWFVPYETDVAERETKRKRKSFHYFITKFSRKSRVFVEFINRQRLFFRQKKQEAKRCNLKFNRKTRRRHNAQHHAYYVCVRMQKFRHIGCATSVKAFKYANQNMLNRDNNSFCYCHFTYFSFACFAQRNKFSPIIH